MWSKRHLTLATLLSPSAMAQVDLAWHPPAQSQINNLTNAVSTTGVYGFIYNTSHTPDAQYGSYNWCNMPHVRKDIYTIPSSDYELVYVELIHRHHKRTPYAANSFPVEPYPWSCSDQGLFYFGRPFGSDAAAAAETYWKGYTSPINPFHPSGWTGDCQFPQITAQGLQDSHQHGADLYAVYHDLLGFLPARDDETWKAQVAYRVTTNQITSQVAAMVINGMWATTEPVPLAVQASAIDSLEPAYSCPASAALFNGIKSFDNPVWKAHLAAAAPLYEVLDDISGVPANDRDFHIWLDHYYDNLSARQCHGYPLPCKLADGSKNSSSAAACVTQALADEVYRFGHWEYSRLYRDEREGLAGSVASIGVWIAEVAQHLRDVKDGRAGAVRWRHNVAHDGSMARVLSVLQVEEMVWPGMGTEVVFEVWKGKKECGKKRRIKSESGFYVRVLFSGRVLRSSNPSLGVMDMLPVETLLAYFDGLVGERAALVRGLCNATSS